MAKAYGKYFEIAQMVYEIVAYLRFFNSHAQQQQQYTLFKFPKLYTLWNKWNLGRWSFQSEQWE